MTATYPSLVDDFIDRLRAEEQRLLVELARVRAILGANEHDGGVGRTDEAIRAVLAARPGRSWTARQMTVEIRGKGWITRSADPENSVRAALARAVNAGRMVRDATGVFRASAARDVDSVATEKS